MNIPRDYSFKGLSGSSEKEQQYWYADSSVLYMTEFINSPNYDVLKNLVSDWALSEAYRNRDTMNFSGRNSLGLYWRERKLRHVAVGYKNVRPEKVVMFDKIIDDIQESNE